MAGWAAAIQGVSDIAGSALGAAFAQKQARLLTAQSSTNTDEEAP